MTAFTSILGYVWPLWAIDSDLISIGAMLLFGST